MRRTVFSIEELLPLTSVNTAANFADAVEIGSKRDLAEHRRRGREFISHTEAALGGRTWGGLRAGKRRTL